MDRRIILLSKAILVITFLNIFAWSVYHVNAGGQKLGILTTALKQFSQFPVLIREVLSEVSDPERYIKFDSSFKPVNNLNYDVFALNSFFSESKWTIELLNLHNDDVIHSWYLEEKNYNNSTNRQFAHAEPISPLVLNDLSIIVHNHETFNLYRLNSNSEVIWHNSENLYHHSFNLDKNGDLWTCTRDLIQSTSNDIEYWDEFLTKVDVASGRVIFQKSLTEILYENNLGYQVHGIGNIVKRNGHDPLHLNEIQPALKNGPHWKEGDLFISLRHRSLILLYRPSTQKIIRVIQGPFYNQHDVDIISDSTISLFNNNVSSLDKVNTTEAGEISQTGINQSINRFSEVLIYNFNDSSFTKLLAKQMNNGGVFTETQGLHHILSNGDLFVESYSQGKVYIFNENGIVLQRYMNKPSNGLVEYPHWVRIYEDLDFLKK